MQALRVGLAVAAMATMALLASSILLLCCPGVRRTSPPRDRQGVRVCIAFDGGTETTTPLLLSSLISTLVRTTDADVTLLLIGSRVAVEGFEGAELEMLPPTAHRYDASRALSTSFRILEWLKAKQPFDHIIFHDSGGAAYYTMLARSQNLALGASHITTIMIKPPVHVLTDANNRRLDMVSAVDSLEKSHMQRSAIALADALFASHSALRLMRERNWRLPPLTVLLNLTAQDLWSPLLRTWRDMADTPRSPLRFPNDTDAGASGYRILVSVCVVHHNRGALLLQVRTHDHVHPI